MQKLRAYFSKAWKSTVQIAIKAYHEKLFILFGALLTYLIQPLVSEPIRILIQRYSSSRELTYRILSISLHEKNELNNLAKSVGLDPFSLNLDDPLLNDYYLIRVRLKNDGAVIYDPLRFKISTGEPYTKIIDIKYKVINPLSKLLQISNSLPALKWGISEDDQPIIASWESQESNSVAGFNVYRSVLKNVGYGRMNEEALTKPEFAFPSDSLRDLSDSYYRVKALGVYGLESGPTDPMRFPEILAFSPFFKGVCWIDPDSPSKKRANGSRTAPFRSVEEAIITAGKTATYLVRRRRDQIVRTLNPVSETPMIYLDDLDFLNGQAEIALYNGMDEKAEIEFFVLCKAILGRNLSFKLQLEGGAGISLAKIGKESSILSQLKKEPPAPKENTRILLTPEEVRTFYAKGIIYLLWEKPQSPAYKGVRIFRSQKGENAIKGNFGQEVYDGSGMPGKLTCTFEARDPIEPKAFLERHNPTLDLLSTQPPPRKRERPPLSPPTNLRISAITEDFASPFFADKISSPREIYTYTIFAYDNNDQYSFPITINASLNRASTKDNCKPAAQ